MGKKPTAHCWECEAAEDSAQHTLEAWAGERQALVGSVGADLFLPAVVRAIVKGKENWRLPRKNGKGLQPLSGEGGEGDGVWLT